MSSESITVPTPAATPAKAAQTEDRIVVARRLVKTYDSGGGRPGPGGNEETRGALRRPTAAGRRRTSPRQRTGHRVRGRADGEPRLGDVPGGRRVDEAPSREERAHVHCGHARQRGWQSDATRHRDAERGHP